MSKFSKKPAVKLVLIFQQINRVVRNAVFVGDTETSQTQLS